MRRSTPWWLLWGTGAFLGVGVALLFNPSGINLAVLMGLHILAENVHPRVIGAILVLVALPALLANAREYHLKRWQILLLIGPQYIMMTMAFLSQAYLIGSGEYRGNPFSFWLAVQVLWPVMFGNLIYIFAVTERYGYRWVPLKEVDSEVESHLRNGDLWTQQ